MGLFQNIDNAVRDFKNSKLADLAINFMNGLIGDYGTIVGFRLDSVTKHIHLDAALKGESQNISVRLEGYQVVHIEHDTYIKFENIFISREWLEKLVRSEVIPKVFPGNMLKVESKYAGVFEFLI